MKFTGKMVNNTIFLSIIVQIITGLVAIPALFKELNDENMILKDVLWLETIVQIIEASFYLYIAYSATQIISITPLRYIDWVITTPTMLISTIMFMQYKQYKEKSEELTTKEFINNNKDSIILIVISNFFMLLFGYLGEKQIINKILSLGLGSIFFIITFYIIYEKYAKFTVTGSRLFYFVFGVWSLYAVAAMMNTNLKNIMYNLLDIVAKNFYGLFLAYYIWKL